MIVYTLLYAQQSSSKWKRLHDETSKISAAICAVHVAAEAMANPALPEFPEANWTRCNREDLLHAITNASLDKTINMLVGRA